MPCYIFHYSDLNSIGKLIFSQIIMQLHYYIDTTPKFLHYVGKKPYNVNYVYTYLLVYNYCCYYYADYSDFVKYIMFIYSLCT